MLAYNQSSLFFEHVQPDVLLPDEPLSPVRHARHLLYRTDPANMQRSVTLGVPT